MTTTARTATGRRLGARSPRLLKNGTKNNTAIKSTGKTRMMKVSISGGLNDNRVKSHRNGHSGRGLAPPSVGSGGPLGPLGPSMAASSTTMMTAREEKKMSFNS